MANPVCAHARPYFADAMDGEPMPPLRRAEVWMHTHICFWCRPLYKSLLENREALRRLRDEVSETPPEP